MGEGPRDDRGWGQQPPSDDGWSQPSGGSGSFPPPPGGERRGSQDYPGGGGLPGWGQQPGSQGEQHGWGGQHGGQDQGWGGGTPGYGAPPRRNGVALASMICGLVALGCLFLFFLLITIPIAVVTGLAAVITGVLGLRAAGREGVGGRGQAITGLVTGTISLLVIGVVTFAAITAWTQLGFETNPITDPEAFLEEMEERGVEVDEEGRVDVEELERQLQEDGEF